MIQNKLEYYKAIISDKDFLRISEFIEKNYGIKLPRQKKSLVQNRLYKRLIATEILSFDKYIDFLFSNDGKAEISSMIDEITTNKTEFFRENKHYSFLENNILTTKRKLDIWSAGCSTGEEPYSLSITLFEKFFDFSILATDLSYKVLEHAKNGIYSEQVVSTVPQNLLNKYFTVVNDNSKNTYKIKDFLKNNIKYSQLNLMNENYNILNNFDIIFFRNVLIYFNHEIQIKILKKIINFLKPDGYLFIGHSESLIGFELPLKTVGHSIFQKK